MDVTGFHETGKRVLKKLVLDFRKMLASQHQPWEARQAFPCLDEPHLKATFDLHVARTTNMTAIANMPLAHTTPLYVHISNCNVLEMRIESCVIVVVLMY